MKVSIITATYNSSCTIKETLLSLEQQTYADIEHIVVDGASTDDTLSLVRAYGSRVNRLISEPDKGIYDALNKGIKAASGEVVGFLHSDDIFAYSEAVAELVSLFQQHQTDAVYADLEYVARTDTSKVTRYWESGKYQRGKMKYGWMPPHPTFYMKRALYEAHGAFDPSFKISADYDALLRYLWTYDVSAAYLPKVLIQMKDGGASGQTLKKIYCKFHEDVRALKNNHLFWPPALAGKKISKLHQLIRK